MDHHQFYLKYASAGMIRIFFSLEIYLFRNKITTVLEILHMIILNLTRRINLACLSLIKRLGSSAEGKGEINFTHWIRCSPGGFSCKWCSKRKFTRRFKTRHCSYYLRGKGTWIRWYPTLQLFQRFPGILILIYLIYVKKWLLHKH